MISPSVPTSILREAILKARLETEQKHKMLGNTGQTLGPEIRRKMRREAAIAVLKDIRDGGPGRRRRRRPEMNLAYPE